ncbi:hypothetical protein [Longitalea luteola]|uniref:hypothetical protein n=1 Tax=Longitalea luteola TaxID=2812563 RepID=UPI001A95DEBA|nr:hypothetical protein [Longitalea luteola]
MKKEEMYFLKLWDDLRSKVEHNKQSITPIDIYKLCSEWAGKIRSTNILKIRELYNLYLAYFEGYNINEYQFLQSWYSLRDLIQFDILNILVVNLEHAIIRCRDIMWEILVFKTNRPCKTCDSELRALTDNKKREIFFCCDNCVYIEDIFGQSVKSLKNQLSPITPEMQEKFLLPPSIP